MCLHGSGLAVVPVSCTPVAEELKCQTLRERVFVFLPLLACKTQARATAVDQTLNHIMDPGRVFVREHCLQWLSSRQYAASLAIVPVSCTPVATEMDCQILYWGADCLDLFFGLPCQ